MKTKNILIATGIFPPQIGGPATYSELLLRELPERGFKVKVESFGWIIHYPKILRHIIYFLRVLRHSFWTHIIYAQDPASVGLPSLIAAKLAGKPFLLKIVGDYAWEQGSQRSGVTDLLDLFSTENEKYPLKVRMMKKVQKFVAEHADRIVVPSKYLKKIVSNWGIDPQKITVVYNCFHPPRVNISREEARKKHGLQGKVMISVGRLVPWKGFAMLIELMPEIVKKIPDAKLVIVGDGPDRGFLEEVIKKSGSKKYVELAGKKPQQELFEMIKASDLFVLNTSYEGLSHQLLEVLALEIPVITTPAGGNIETIDDKVNGLLVPYNEREEWKNAIEDILMHPEKGDAFREAGLQKLEGFGEGRMLSEVSEVLRHPRG